MRAWLRDAAARASARRVARSRRAARRRAAARASARRGDSTVAAQRLRAEAPDHVWARDFQFDQTADGRILKLLHVVDEFTREALAIECHRRIDADKTVAVLDRLVGERRNAPAFIRCDNGPELTANALRDDISRTNAGDTNWVVFAAEAPADAKITLDEEHDRYDWLTLDEAVARIAPSRPQTFLISASHEIAF